MATKKAAQKANYGTGRRKTSVARAFMKKGAGKILINGKDLDVYFGRKTDRIIVRQPLELLEVANNFDFYITSNGGGSTGQSGAIRLAIARALVEHSEENRKALRAAGYLTRDAREVERKKIGLHGARKGTQYSKR